MRRFTILNPIGVKILATDDAQEAERVRSVCDRLASIPYWRGQRFRIDDAEVSPYTQSLVADYDIGGEGCA